MGEGASFQNCHAKFKREFGLKASITGQFYFFYSMLKIQLFLKFIDKNIEQKH